MASYFNVSPVARAASLGMRVSTIHYCIYILYISVYYTINKSTKLLTFFSCLWWLYPLYNINPRSQRCNAGSVLFNQ